MFLGAGSGEALNEVPLGLDWPEPGEMLERFEAGLRGHHPPVGRRDGDHGRRLVCACKEAKLYTRATSRPKLYVSAFGPAGRADRRALRRRPVDAGRPRVRARRSSTPTSRRAARDGREPGEIILQSGFNLAEDEEAAIASTRKWKATQLEEVYRDDLHDPAEMLAKAEAEVTDEQFAKEGFIVSADPDEHVERIRQLEAIHEATTTIVLQGIGADPLGSIRRYGEHVLPALRSVRTA